MWRPFRSKSVGVGTKIRLEDSFEDQFQCALHHAIANTRNLKCSDFAITLRDLHPTVRHGFVPACDKLFPHRRQKRDPPRGLDVPEALAVDARGTAVSFGDPISLLKGLDLRDVHEQTPETMRRFRLRLSINPPSQFLQTAGCLCHLTPASPCRTEYSPVRALPSGRVLLHAHQQYYGPIRHPDAYAGISHSRL